MADGQRAQTGSLKREDWEESLQMVSSEWKSGGGQCPQQAPHTIPDPEVTDLRCVFFEMRPRVGQLIA